MRERADLGKKVGLEKGIQPREALYANQSVLYTNQSPHPCDGGSATPWPEGLPNRPFFGEDLAGQENDAMVSPFLAIRVSWIGFGVTSFSSRVGSREPSALSGLSMYGKYWPS